jgi:hypothetical protein
MSDSNSNCGGFAARNRKNTLRLGYWTGAWLITMAIAVFGPILVWQNKMLTGAAIVINVAVGVGMIVANKNHLGGLDELQQKIQLEAMALALGVGLVFGLGYSTMDVTNFISADAEISHLVMLIGLTYGAGVILGHRKYR